MLIRRVSTHLRYYSCISRMFSGGIHRCKINRDLLVSEQITNHRPARIAESSPPQQGARRIIISVTSDTSDRCSLAPPAASRLCASWKSTAIFRANSSEAAKACHKGLRPPCANPALKSTNASINSARCFVGQPIMPRSSASIGRSSIFTENGFACTETRKASPPSSLRVGGGNPGPSPR